MRGKFQLGDRAAAMLERADGTMDLDGVKLDLSGLDLGAIGVGGHFIVECFDRDGNLRWEDTAENGVTNAALDDVLNVYLRNTTATATWYLGLVDNAGFTAFAAADTSASHTGWAESTAYSNSTRIAWSPGASSSQAVTNGTTADFSMNATATIKGLFVIAVSTKGGSTGLLFSTAAFSGGNQSVNSGDTLKVTYTVSAASS